MTFSPYFLTCTFLVPVPVCNAVFKAWDAVATCFDRAVGSPIGSLFAKASSSSGLHVSQISFLASVLLNCPLAAATKWIPKGNARHVFGAVTTLSLLALAYGRDFQQFVYAGAFVYALMRMFPGDCGYCTWATVFTYQIYL